MAPRRRAVAAPVRYFASGSVAKLILWLAGVRMDNREYIEGMKQGLVFITTFGQGRSFSHSD
jgi:hypothetical protein